MIKNLTVTLIITCISLSSLTAQTTAEKKAPSQWWLKSSLTDSVDTYLFHLEAQYSYTKMNGTIDGEIQSGSGKFFIRKNIFTNVMEYSLDKTDLVLETMGMKYLTESHGFTDYLDVDISKLLYAEGGFIWEKDNTLFIKNRYSLYAGIGLDKSLCQKHYIRVLAAVGRINQDYTIPVDNLDMVKGAYSALYIRQYYKIVFDQRFSFQEQAYYFNNLNHSNRYRLGIGLNFYIGIIQPVSLTLGYNYKFDKENEFLGIDPENETQSIGINVSL